MSDLWFNLRVWIYHIQAGRYQWWKFQISRNEYHLGNKESKLIQLYQLDRPRSYCGGGSCYGDKD